MKLHGEGDQYQVSIRSGPGMSGEPLVMLDGGGSNDMQPWDRET